MGRGAHAHPLSLCVVVTNDAHFNVLKQIDWPKVAILTIQEFASQI